MKFLSNILLLSTLIVLSLSGLHFVNRFINKYKPNYSKKKKKVILFASIIILLIITYSMFDWTLFKAKEMSVNHELRHRNDSIFLISKLKFIDSLKYHRVINSINQFYKYSNLHLVDSVLFFFTDTVERYFLLQKVPKSKIKSQIRWYWRTYPYDKFVYYNENIDTTFYKYDSCLVSIYGKNYKFCNKAVNIRTDIKFNNKLKIFYIRSFYDVDILSEMQQQTEQSKQKIKKLRTKHNIK